jgi:CheY-like chemotaxis protein
MSAPTPAQQTVVSQLLGKLWEKHKDAVFERIRILEQTAEIGPALTPNTREHARVAAHKLAGCLGTFGYAQSGVQAREIEHLLEQPMTTLRMHRLVQLVRTLRTGLPVEQKQATAPQVSDNAGCSDVAATELRVEYDVLIVEDDELLSALISEGLTREGFRVQCVGNGVDAIRALTSFSPRVVLLDIDLPGLDGLSFLRTLSTRGLLANLKVIMLTAHSEQQHVMESLGLGACGFIAKRCELTTAIERIRAVLGSAS